MTGLEEGWGAPAWEAIMQREFSCRVWPSSLSLSQVIHTSLSAFFK